MDGGIYAGTVTDATDGRFSLITILVQSRRSNSRAVKNPPTKRSYERFLLYVS